MRRGGEGLSGKALAVFEIRLTLFGIEQLKQRAVSLLSGHAEHVLVVLGRSSDQGDTSDVDLFDDRLF